jgi:60 kDa SS-A/Ro ribonucleoprotein
MTAPYAQHYSTLQTPQSEPIPGSTQRRNSAGGYSFAVDDWISLDRFLILGAEGGSYYATERTLTLENAQNVRRCLTLDGARTVRRIVEVSEGGRAPKNDPAIFLLALAASVGDANTRSAALAALPRVCRTGTHLFQFAAFVQSLRGWGRALRRGVANWYIEKDARQLAYQLAKYYGSPTRALRRRPRRCGAGVGARQTRRLRRADGGTSRSAPGPGGGAASDDV